MRIQSDNNGFFIIKVDVIDADIRLLLSLRDVKNEELLLNYLGNELEHRSYNCTIPITYKNEHSLISRDYHDIFCTCSKIRHYHLQFLHFTADKLFQLLQRAYPQDVDESVKQLRHEIEESCEQCRQFSPSPL